jgi:membrane associated rhomboid family serine protease
MSSYYKNNYNQECDDDINNINNNNSNNNNNIECVHSVWWLDGNDEDLQRTAYDDTFVEEEEDNNNNNNNNTNDDPNVIEQQLSSFSRYQPRSVRQHKNKKQQHQHQQQINAKSHKSTSQKRSTDDRLKSPPPHHQQQQLQQQKSPNTGKTTRCFSVDDDKITSSTTTTKVTSQQKRDNNNTMTIRWNCTACTYLNVRRHHRPNHHQNHKMDHSSPHFTCEICATPRNVTTTNTTQSRSLCTKNRLPSDIPTHPGDGDLHGHLDVNVNVNVNVGVERTWKDDHLGDSNSLEEQNQTTKGKLLTTTILPFHTTTGRALERLFGQQQQQQQQKRQNSTLTSEMSPAASTNDFEISSSSSSSSSNIHQPENSVDTRSDTASLSLGSGRVYSVAELVASLGGVDTVNGTVDLPPALERRVRDFKFAQTKRRERHGHQKPWGIYGLYAHLSDIRADLEWAEDAAWRRQRGQPYLSWRDFDKSRDKGLQNRPLFTYGLLALCTIMMVVTLGVNGWKFEPLTVNPLIGPSSQTLIQCGARDTNLIVNEGQWYRLFTPMILHAGLVHFFVNMMALYFIGGAVEQSHGFASTAVLFIIPAVGGNILSAICLPQYISVGASGGIFGLIGGCIADICLNWNLLFLKTTTDASTRLSHFYVLLWLGVDIIVNCLFGFTPLVDNFTHLGGFLYGFCCGISTIERLAVGFFGINIDKCSQLGNSFMRFFGLIISIIAIMVTTIILVQSDGLTSPCPGCRYISCIPFPPHTKDKWWYCDDCDIVTADLFRSGQDAGVYQQINLYCPNGDVEEILIANDGIDDKEVLRRALPSYCRAHCEDVFAT